MTLPPSESDARTGSVDGGACSVGELASGLPPSPALITSERGENLDRPGPPNGVEAGTSSHQREAAEPPTSTQKLWTSQSTGSVGEAGSSSPPRTGGVGAPAPTETDLPDDDDDVGEEAALKVIEASEAWTPANLNEDSDPFPDEGEATRLDGVVTSGVPDGSESAITQERVVNEYEGAMVQVGSYTGPLIANVKPGEQPVSKLTHRIKYVAHLAALGMTSQEIGDKSGYSTSTVNKLLRAPLVSLEVERARQSFFKQDPDTSLRIMIPKALTAIGEVLDSTEEKRSLKVDTAFRLLERTHGKPKQSVDMGGSLLKDLFELLDQRDAAAGMAKAIEVKAEEAEIVPEKLADPLDEALDAFSVGADRGRDAK